MKVEAVNLLVAAAFVLTAARWINDSFYIAVVWLIPVAGLLVGWRAAGKRPAGVVVWNLSWRYALWLRLPVVLSIFLAALLGARNGYHPERRGPGPLYGISILRDVWLAEVLWWLLTLYFVSLIGMITVWLIRLRRRISQRN